VALLSVTFCAEMPSPQRRNRGRFDRGADVRVSGNVFSSA